MFKKSIFLFIYCAIVSLSAMEKKSDANQLLIKVNNTKAPFEMRVTENHKVKDVKVKFLEHKGVPVDQQILTARYKKLHLLPQQSPALDDGQYIKDIIKQYNTTTFQLCLKSSNYKNKS